MTYLNKLSLRADNIIFSNNILNKTIFTSKNGIKSVKNNKNIYLRLNKTNNRSSERKTILKNINKKYIEKNILRKNESFLSFHQAYSFNNNYINDENKINDERKIADKIRYKFRKIKNINFQEIINSNDINFKFFNFTKQFRNTNIINYKQFNIYEYNHKNNNANLSRNNPKKLLLLTSKSNNKERCSKKIHLRRIRINNKYKTINFDNSLTKNIKNFNINKLHNDYKKDINDTIKSKEFSKAISDKQKINREKSEIKFYKRLKKNSSNNIQIVQSQILIY